VQPALLDVSSCQNPPKGSRGFSQDNCTAIQRQSIQIGNNHGDVMESVRQTQAEVETTFDKETVTVEQLFKEDVTAFTEWWKPV
jgi:hypothetical protein